MDEEKNDERNGRKLIRLEKMRKKCREQGRGRMNLTGRRLSGMDCLPIRLEQKGNEHPFAFDLNKMPHLSITGGTPEWGGTAGQTS